MKDTDGNIGGITYLSNEKITGLLFDISKQKTIFSSEPGQSLKDKLEGKVVELSSIEDLESLGIKNTEAPENGLFFGVVYYHVKHFFDIQGDSGRLFLMFADCGTDWNALSTLQVASGGVIRQIGVYTDQSLWKKIDSGSGNYQLQLVESLNKKAKELADNHAPVSIFLQANSAMLATNETAEAKIDLTKIPTCMVGSRYVTVLLGQEMNEKISKMQMKNKEHTPVGCLGAVLGCTALAEVHESFAWVQKFNVIGQFPEIEMGFGDMTDKSGLPTSSLPYSSMTNTQLDTLDDKGYVFLIKYAGLEGGVYFSKDQTCANILTDSSLTKSDYCTVARNRTINKARRLVREALLPYVNSPLKVDPSTGMLSSAKITMFNNIVKDVLTRMQDNGEVSGFKIVIDKNQNVLKNDTLIIKFYLVPIGVASRIEVVEGLALTNK